MLLPTKVGFTSTKNLRRKEVHQSLASANAESSLHAEEIYGFPMDSRKVTFALEARLSTDRHGTLVRIHIAVLDFVGSLLKCLGFQ